MCYIHCIILENGLFGCFGIFWIWGGGGNFEPLSAYDCCFASWMFLGNPWHHSRIFQPQASLVFALFITGFCVCVCSWESLVFMSQRVSESMS